MAKKKTKVFVNAKAMNIGDAVPIDMKDFPDVDKPVKRKPKKRETPKRPVTESTKPKAEPSPAPAKAESKEPVETDDLKLWKAQVLMAVEKILDDSILALAKGEAA